MCSCVDGVIVLLSGDSAAGDADVGIVIPGLFEFRWARSGICRSQCVAYVVRDLNLVQAFIAQA